MEAAYAAHGAPRSSYNLKPRTRTSTSLVISDSESESGEDRHDECSPSKSSERPVSSSSATPPLPAGKQRQRPSGTPTTSPPKATNRKSIAPESTASRASVRTKGRQAIAEAETGPVKTASQTEKAATRTTGSRRRPKRQQQMEASKTARTSEPAKQSMSFAALLQRQSNAEPSGKENAESSNSMANLLLPGASALYGRQFLSAQAIFDILSDPTDRERAVHTIPNGPKVNCYFIVNIGAKLTDYNTFDENRLKIRFKLREGSGVWDYKTEDSDCYTVSDSGVLKPVTKRFKNRNAHFDLRLHRSVSRQSGHFADEQPYERSICWFFNSERAPAPGFFVVSFLGAPHSLPTETHKRPHESHASITRSTNNATEEEPTSSVEVDEPDELPPPAKRRR